MKIKQVVVYKASQQKVKPNIIPKNSHLKNLLLAILATSSTNHIMRKIKNKTRECKFRTKRC